MTLAQRREERERRIWAAWSADIVSAFHNPKQQSTLSDREQFQVVNGMPLLFCDYSEHFVPFSVISRCSCSREHNHELPGHREQQNANHYAMTAPAIMIHRGWSDRSVYIMIHKSYFRTAMLHGGFE